MTGGVDRRRAFQTFEQALALNGPARESFLAEQCAGEPELRAEIDALLAAATRDAETHMLLGPEARAAENLVGREFGRFRLVEFVGAGGMGVVYRAERTDGIRQSVAVKLIAHEFIQAGQDRFKRETQLLARLEHPLIARLIDAGVDAGRPWLALEFVAGRPIDVYCDEKNLSLRDRLKLLADLAGAVAEAHRMLVVHRDIKPGNVLVTATGAPKLIDFGIAAVLESDGAAHSPTADVGRLFTPHYAAPEQVAGEPVSVATDVFGLGALGYRLLTGHTVYAEARGAVDYLLAITRREIPPPSRVASGHADPSRAKALRGDLDAILCKALERDPQHRYASATDLQADLQRYLDDEPVRARPPSMRIRVGKFVRRNAVAVGISALLLAAMLAGIIAYGLQARRTNEARDAAARRGDFLVRLLNSADPRRGGKRDVTVAQLLDSSMPQIQGMAEQEPLAAASMYGLLAQTNLGLGRGDEGLAASSRAIELLRAHGAVPRDLAEALTVRGQLYLNLGRPQDAEGPLREALALVERQRGAARQLADALDALAQVCQNTGREAEAEALFKREIDVQRDSHEDFGGRAGYPLNGLGEMRFNQGRYAESASFLSQSLAIQRKYFAPEDPNLLDAEYNEAMALERDSQAAAAEPIFRELLASYGRIFGTESYEYLSAQQGLAHDLMSQRRYQEAADEALPAARGLGRVKGEDNPWTLTAWGVYGISACLAGHDEEGLTAMRRVAALRAAAGAPNGWTVMSTHVQIGVCLVSLRRYAEAEPLLLHAAAVLEQDRGITFDRTQAAFRALRDLYAGLGKSGDAAYWQAKILPAAR